MPAPDLAAKLAVRGLLLFNAPALFNSLYKMDWYGGILRQWTDGLSLPKASDVIEIGCGPGGLSAYLAQTGHRTTGVDRSTAMIKLAKRSNNHGVNFKQADALAVPFADQAFDAVIAASLMNVIGDKRGLIKEMCRMARAGACISVLFPLPVFDQQSAAYIAKENRLGRFESAAIELWASGARKLEAEVAEQCMKANGLEIAERQYFLSGNLVAVNARKLV